MKRLCLCTCSVAAAVCIVATVGAAAFAQSDDLARAPRISMPEFKALLSRGDVLVLDVRDAESYRIGHIPGARSLPLAEVAASATKLRSEKRPIVTYCA